MLAAARAPRRVRTTCAAAGRTACAILLDMLVGAVASDASISSVDPARLRPSDQPVIAGDHARLTAETGLDAGDPDRADARRPAELLAHETAAPDAPLMTRTPALSEVEGPRFSEDGAATGAHGDGRLRAAAAIHRRGGRRVVLAGGGARLQPLRAAANCGQTCIARPNAARSTRDHALSRSRFCCCSSRFRDRPDIVAAAWGILAVGRRHRDAGRARDRRPALAVEPREDAERERRVRDRRRARPASSSPGGAGR